MSLPLLINSADCGPVNPLAGLVKNVDRDRGVQQDFFGSGRAGSSRDAFRTQQAASPGLNQEVSQFFGPQAGPSSPLALTAHANAALDLSALRTSLPQYPAVSPQPQHVQAPAGPSWAADFLSQHGGKVSSPVSSSRAMSTQNVQAQQPFAAVPMQASSPAFQSQPWASPMNATPSPQLWMPQPNLSSQAQSVSFNPSLLEREFQTHEADVTARSRSANNVADATQSPAAQQDLLQQSASQGQQEGDELARTAHLLIESVKDEQNPKFKNSEFLKLMRSLRDGEMTVKDNDMVARDATMDVQQTDAKGKGKAMAPGGYVISDPSASGIQTFTTRRKSVHFEGQESMHKMHDDTVMEDPNDEYFRRDNEEFMRYWNNEWKKPEEAATTQAPFQSQWGVLQDDWDAFEATASGIKPVQVYPFIRNNPYLDRSSTRQHDLHVGMSEREVLYQNVLELEARVQGDMQNARAWFELGIKEQESEREHKAVMALRRALELDPSHLESRLALAISLTNEGNIAGADEEIIEWITRNERYADVTKSFDLPVDTKPLPAAFSQLMVVHKQLIGCLIAMARSRTSDVDADVQIALAALLNASEEYDKAHDCFRTALAVRPDDWQLYNRVGATLANSGNAEAALEYYYRALALNPGYIRARFNLGISCMNMKRYEEAAEHLLNALLLQESDSVASADGLDDRTGVTSNSLWESMKTACVQSGRMDLAMLCSHRNIEELRKAFQPA